MSILNWESLSVRCECWPKDNGGENSVPICPECLPFAAHPPTFSALLFSRGCSLCGLYQQAPLMLERRQEKQRGEEWDWNMYSPCLLPAGHYCGLCDWRLQPVSQPSANYSNCSLLLLLQAYLAHAPFGTALLFLISLLSDHSFANISLIRIITNYSSLYGINFLTGSPSLWAAAAGKDELCCTRWILELLPLSQSSTRNFLTPTRRHSTWYPSHCHGTDGWTIVTHKTEYWKQSERERVFHRITERERKTSIREEKEFCGEHTE